MGYGRLCVFVCVCVCLCLCVCVLRAHPALGPYLKESERGERVGGHDKRDCEILRWTKSFSGPACVWLLAFYLSSEEVWFWGQGEERLALR
jgi:hypothetical protein